MRRFTSFTSYLSYINEEESKYTIYLDLDGVLCDFIKGASDATDLPIRDHEDWEKVKDTQWKMIADIGKDFWAKLNWTSDGKKLWDYVKQFRPNILSAFPQAPENKQFAVEGKYEWIKRELRGYDNIYLVKGQDKQIYANPTSILIDDSGRNIKQWLSKGGIGILHRNANDTIRRLKELI